MDFSIIVQYLYSGLIFLIFLSIMVLIHEFGHYIAARKVGAKVEEFAFGFGHAIFSKKIGDTVYRWNWIPLGGYCKILGEGQDIESKDSFSTKGTFQKLFVLLSGVLMNFILAIIVFYIFLGISNWKTEFSKASSSNVSFVGADVKTYPYIRGLLEDMPAYKAKIPEFSIVKSVNGKYIAHPEEFKNLIRNSYGETLDLELYDVLERKTAHYNVPVTGRNTKNEPAIGVGLEESYQLDYSNNKLGSGISHSINAINYSIQMMGELFQKSIDDKNVESISKGTAGIIKLAQITNFGVKNNLWLDLLNMLALVNISLAIMNLLPILPLDGGYAAIVVIEGIIRRKLNDKLKNIISIIGLILILGLFVFVTVNDLSQLGPLKWVFSGLGWKY